MFLQYKVAKSQKGGRKISLCNKAAMLVVFSITSSAAQAAEMTYDDVASSPCNLLVAIEGSAMFAAPSEALGSFVAEHYPKQTDGMSSCNIYSMIVAICKRHQKMAVGDAVKYFLRGKNLPPQTRCGA